MKGKLMKKVTSDHLTAEQRAELSALAALPDDQINTRDIPEQREWRDARRGMFYRPIKQQLTLRLDREIVDWFRRHSTPEERYQTCINKALREYIDDHDRQAA
jgi:uncharacterized protein (DUF4415 family)